MPRPEAHAEAAVAPSGYQVFRGDQFFVLSDESYGSGATALVRIEAPAHLEGYSGVDIIVYRVDDPFQWLKKQKNLHRIELKGQYAGEGLANTLRYLWDSWYKKARYAWERLFASSARKKVTTEAPELKRHPRMNDATVFENNPQYKPLPGYKIVERFRYPLWKAKPIEPPKDLQLEGSSGNFIGISEGNVRVPIGKHKPGLYLVEAVIGSFRATTLVFVSDTIAVTKISSDQLMVWTVNRRTGKAVGGVKTAWTDGLGTLKSGTTDKNGALVLARKSPEHTYVVGRDQAGGVFISENFYYDSEIYNAKIYGFSDRPLYRPGDTVRLKFIGREFKDARRSVALAGGDLTLRVIDPNGVPLLSRTLKVSPDSGADTRFTLPANAVAGGYDLRFDYRGNTYGGAFRVAEYVKPHFEINLVAGKREFKTGEAITGKIILTYPDGKPVSRAAVQMTVKSQPLTMVENELRYSGQFPVKLDTEELDVRSDGTAAFTLPPADKPSRYIITLLANDDAAYRVKATKEILIERGAALYRLTAGRNFTAPGESVNYRFQTRAAGGSSPVKWEVMRLESQQKTEGTLNGSSNQFTVLFSQSGSYTVMLRDKNGSLLAAANHWVSGKGLQVVPGSIEIVFDKDSYLPGETAKALITFPEPVGEALLTLERDRVEKHALMTEGGSWIRPKKISAAQWQAEIRVGDNYAPNMTFSVLYCLHGDYVFQNRGLKVAQEAVALQFMPDKTTYQPGEKVTVEVVSSVKGKPVPAHVAVSVVDEMVYVLQPEIAPDMFDFFYHPRRNNVRTSSSLSFISYDMALSPLAVAPSRTNTGERVMKVLERPRRDNIDTAFWTPTLKTDRRGRARFSFVMPDALTRWRITGRATTTDGFVGQTTASIQSFKPLYLTWTGPVQYRRGDAPVVSVIAFNQTQQRIKADVSVSGGGLSLTRKLDLKPGPNYVSIPAKTIQDGPVTLALIQNGKTADRLTTFVSTRPDGWTGLRSLMVPVTKKNTPVALPADAVGIRVNFAGAGADHFNRIVDDLVEFPWGCVEQTASRLIPLSLAYQSMGAESGRTAERILPVLQSNRLRLAHMAGPEAVFGWWGDMTEGSALWTAYAYYADWYAGRALRVDLPAGHWAHVLDAYKKYSSREPLLHRALTLWFAAEMGLPVKTMLDGLQDEMKLFPPANRERTPSVESSPILAEPDQATGRQMAYVLIGHLASRQRRTLTPAASAAFESARNSLGASNLPVVKALLLMSSSGGRGGQSQAAQIDAVLAEVRQEMPTFDRALTLVWLQSALGGRPAGKPVSADLTGDWKMSTTETNTKVWRFTGVKLTNLILQAEPERPMTALIRYESTVSESPALPVGIDRKLYHLSFAKGSGYAAEPVKDGAALKSGQLYLEEITLTPREKRTFRYGLLEAPLPPGADVERTTWNMQIAGLGSQGPHRLEKTRHEPGQLSYSVPIDVLDKPVTVRHLLRFSQKGKFTLPPARFYRMYQPEQKAFVGGEKSRKTVEVF